jgi:polysaccharide biosynthesis protein PslH
LTRVASLVSYQVIPAKMGGQKGIYLFLQYFSKHCNLVCYTIKDNQPTGTENFTVKNILGNGKSRYINLSYFFSLKKEFKKDKITHLIIEHPYYGWLAVLLKRFARVKLIVHSHNIESLRFRTTGKWWWGVLWWYERFTHRAADANFFISEEDKKYAVEKFGLTKEKCTVITYGTEKNQVPAPGERNVAKKEICAKHNIEPSGTLFLYNGTLNYPPNKKALDFILNDLNPLLEKQQALRYTILICGNKLPPAYDELAAFKSRNIVYAGFVNDIDIYFKGADIFLNPLSDGGGIKTKLVEALAANNTAISFMNGAIGDPTRVTGNKLFVVPDNDLNEFEFVVEKAIQSSKEDLPADFFLHFYWDNIAKKAAAFIETIKD